MSGKNVVHLRTTFVTQFAVVDEDGNTLSIHETDPMWTGALTQEEFIKTMQQLRATRKTMMTEINAPAENPVLDVQAEEVEPGMTEVDTPSCGENR